MMEIARDLGVELAELRDDLSMLHLSGIGNGPGEMIDLEHSWKAITVLDDQGLNKPLRLTSVEATALVLLLESFESMPAIVDREAARGAIAKLRSAIGRASVVQADETPHQHHEDEVAQHLHAAMRRQQQVTMSYYSASSNALSDRAIQPLSFFHRDGHTYVRASESGREKTFRLDRIRNIHQCALEPPVEEPERSKSSTMSTDMFGTEGFQTATLQVRKDAMWLAHYWEITFSSSKECGNEQPPQQETDWVEANMSYGSEDWLIRFCLHYGDIVKIVSPAHLGYETVRRARSALQALD